MEIISIKEVSFSAKNSKSVFFGFFRNFCLSLLLSSFVLSVYSNNIRINGAVKVSDGLHPDSLLLSFSLRWDHSWRDDFNWDAAWIFFKYKTVDAAWKHVNLGNAGHHFQSASGEPYTFMTGKTGSDVIGLFVFRDSHTSGSVELECRVSCARTALGNQSVDAFSNNEAFILAQGIEMVYIPYGAYDLGDGTCNERFAGAKDGSPALVEREGILNTTTATRIFTVAGGNVVTPALTLSANYPKGYGGFYIMKYEVSQEQYVSFLNNLTYTQQQERVPRLTSLKQGDYIFGDPARPSCRNGIIVEEVSFEESPVLFANNLTNDGRVSQADDGKTVACNYLSPADIFAYCSWSGLRPMSELEYEKACRPGYPSTAVQGEYAWNASSLPVSVRSLTGAGSAMERPGEGNSNFGSNAVGGPVRCGAFATSESSAESAGATFWGVMEMSGNLREFCYNINEGGVFDGTILGDGKYNTTKWNRTVTNFGVRGGGFTSNSLALRISDRSEINYFPGKNVNYRDSTVGFRAVRPVNETVNPGSLIVKKADGTASKNGCLGTVNHIESATPASVGLSGMNFSYMWYVMEPGSSAWTLLAGETGETLDYQNFVNDGTTNVVYQFRRKAICPVGEGATAVLSLSVPNTKVNVFPRSIYLDGANAAGRRVVATVTQTGGTMTWLTDKGVLGSGADIINVSAEKTSYRPSRVDFGDFKQVKGNLGLTCRYTIGDCKMDSVIIVEVAPYDTEPCTGTILDTDDPDRHFYRITKIGNQCWMQDNMNIGKLSQINNEANYWRHDDPGIQKYCNGSPNGGGTVSKAANCDKYGGLYEWWEVVCAGYCPNLKNPNRIIEIGEYASIEEALKVAVPDVVMTPNGRRVRGICPKGWHLPTNEEWKQLEMYLGMTRAQAEIYSLEGTATNTTDGWGRQTGTPPQGKRMKSKDTWNGTSTLNAADDRDRFYGQPAGRRLRDGAGFSGWGAHGAWWTSSASNEQNWARILNSDYVSVRLIPNYRSVGLSVRCIRD